MSLPILVVEDNNINREVAILQLQALGFACAVANNGQQALQAIKQNQYSLILMDVMMPGLNGWETARRIRCFEQSKRRHTPIIGVSAWSANDNRERCLSAGMDDYLHKPYNRAELKMVIERWGLSDQQVEKNGSHAK